MPFEQKLKNPAITIGNFDGVHMGHRALFQRVKQWAGELDGESVVLTFDPHPLEVLNPQKAPSFITSHHHKLDLIASCGIDATIVIPFDHEFSQISAREFVEVDSRSKNWCPGDCCRPRLPVRARP